MVTYNNAIDILKQVKSIYNDVVAKGDTSEDAHIVGDSFDKAITALNKQIATKPEIWKNKKFICPTCHTEVKMPSVGTNDVYCEFCGQRLKWGY